MNTLLEDENPQDDDEPHRENSLGIQLSPSPPLLPSPPPFEDLRVPISPTSEIEHVIELC